MQPTSEPITILMPVKNGQKFLSQAILDIEANMECSDEIIVVEDGSSDGTKDLLLNWKKNQDRLTVISTGGEGLVHALNLGISVSNHDWIARFDVDDRYDKNRLNSQRKHFTQDTAAVFCDYTFSSTNISNLGWIPCAVTPEATTISLISSQRTPHPGVVFNKSAVQDAGMYLSGDYPAEDLSLWLRLSKQGKLIGIPEKLLHYTLNPGSITSQHREMALQTKGRLLSENPIDVNLITNLLENWENLIEYYDTLDFGARRKVLLFRDLVLCLNRNLIPSTHTRLVKRIGLSVLFDRRSYGEFGRMFVESQSRAKFRNSI